MLAIRRQFGVGTQSRAGVLPLAATVLAVTVQGCANNGPPASSGSETPSPTSTPTPTATVTPGATKTTPALPVVAEPICDIVTERDIARALETVAATQVRKDTRSPEDCSFDLAGGAVRVALRDVLDPGDDVTSATAASEESYGGGTSRVPGLRGPGYIVVGNLQGDERASAAGAVRRGDYVTTVFVLPLSQDVAPEDLRPGTLRILRMLSTK